MNMLSIKTRWAFRTLIVTASLFTLTAHGQPDYLTRKELDEDFHIFKEGLREGHAGLYYFIDKEVFQFKCDSVQATFGTGLSSDDFSLKLRFLLASLRHGHTRITPPNVSNLNYKMAVLDTQRLYLPFKLIISGNTLILAEDCSREQLFNRYAVIKTINNIKADALIKAMLPYLSADGINKTFKVYSLYNYFYFHYLYELLFPEQTGVKIELENDNTHYYIRLLKPTEIQDTYLRKTGTGISQYGKQLEFKAKLTNHTAYLKIGSFYRGLIEQFGQSYESFLDSCFSSLHASNTKNLIVDLRDNEGGGDNYDNMLIAYLIGKRSSAQKPVITVPGREFRFVRYSINLSDDIKGFIANPGEFLENDSSLQIKDTYVAMMSGPEFKPNSVFSGKIIVLMNGGSFSASNAVIGELYNSRKKTGRDITFIGEENGGDVYSGTGCAGQGYVIRLPNSQFQIDMPFLCFGTLRRDYPKKRIPDYTLYPTATDLKAGKDTVLDFAMSHVKGVR